MAIQPSTAPRLHLAVPAGDELAPDRLLIQGQSILKQLEEMNILSHEKIISCKEMYNSTESAKTLYARFKKRLFTHEDFTQAMLAARSRYKMAAISLSFSDKTDLESHDDEYAVTSAIIHNERIGLCGELSFEAQLMAKIQGLSAITLTMLGETIPGSSRTNDHALVLLAETEDFLTDAVLEAAMFPWRRNFVKTMQGLRNVVVIDPYLNRAIKSTEIEKDPEFISLLTALKVCNIANRFRMVNSPEMLIARRAKIIEQEKIIGPTPEFKDAACTQFVRIKRRNLTIKRLSRLFPETKGLWEKNNTSIRIQAPQAIVQKVRETLVFAELPFVYDQIWDSEDYFLVIDIESYCGMQKIYETLKAIG